MPLCFCVICMRPSSIHEARKNINQDEEQHAMNHTTTKCEKKKTLQKGQNYMTAVKLLYVPW